MSRADDTPDPSRAEPADAVPTDAHLGGIPNPEESLALLGKAQAGDRGALDSLLSRYQERIYRIVRIRLGARLRGFLESGDIVQGTNIVAMRKIDEFEARDQASIVQWLARIAENQIRDAGDYIRAQKRDRGREVALDSSGSSDGAEEALPAPSGLSPSSAAAQAELQEFYDACVQELGSDQREAILLRDYHGGSWPFVCEQLGRPNVHAAQELYRRAQIRLASLLRKRLRTQARPQGLPNPPRGPTAT